MFGINFSELVVCFVVALVVLGPERLPETVRTLGLWIGRFKRSLRETRESFEQQIGMDDVRRQLHTEEMMRTLDDMQEEIDSALYYEQTGKKLADKNLVESSNIQSGSIANNEILPVTQDHTQAPETLPLLEKPIAKNVVIPAENSPALH